MLVSGLCVGPDAAEIAVEACAGIAGGELTLRLFLTADFASCNAFRSCLELFEIAAEAHGGLKPAVALDGQS
jgi:hypothetical protein